MDVAVVILFLGMTIFCGAGLWQSWRDRVVHFDRWHPGIIETQIRNPFGFWLGVSIKIALFVTCAFGTVFIAIQTGLL